VGLCEALLHSEIQAYCANSQAYMNQIVERRIEDDRLARLLDHLWQVYRRLVAAPGRGSSLPAFSLQACQVLTKKLWRYILNDVSNRRRCMISAFMFAMRADY